MGVTTGWLALQGLNRESVLEAMGLVEVGDCSDYLNCDYTCADLPNGWFVVVANDRRFEVTQALKAVSAHGAALGGWMSETVMVSELYSYAAGAQVWSVVHDPDEDFHGAQVEGAPPPAYDEIRARLLAESEADADGDEDGTDYLFDLPLDLSVAVCGFRPDAASAGEWTQLQLKGAAAKSHPKSKTSLRAEMKKELIPFMLARGWAEQAINASDSPGNGLNFHRRLGNYTCQLWFDYSSSPDVRISPRFSIKDVSSQDHRGIVQGNPRDTIRHIPFWKRLLGLEKPPPPIPDDPNAAQIEKAKALAVDMEAFIDTGEVRPTIQVSFSRTAASWPETRDAPEA